MALQVTGDLLINDLKYPNAKINLVPHLEVYGVISMDAHVLINNTQKTTIPYHSVDRSLLVYDDEMYDAYDNLIFALENYVKADLLSKNPDVTIEKWVAEPTPEPTPEP